MNRLDMLRKLAAELLACTVPHPLRVAIDGVDAAGKTTLADALAEQLASCGRVIIRASIDGFHNSKAVRHLDESPLGFFERSFNYAALCTELLAPLGPGGSRLIRRGVYDFRGSANLLQSRAR